MDKETAELMMCYGNKIYSPMGFIKASPKLTNSEIMQIQSPRNFPNPALRSYPNVIPSYPSYGIQFDNRWYNLYIIKSE